MLIHLISFYLTFCAGLALLQGTDQVLRKKESMNWPGLFLFASNTVLLFHYALYLEGWATEFRYFAALFIPAALTIGPANLLYFKKLVEYDSLPRRQWLHIVPAGFVFVIIAAFQARLPETEVQQEILQFVGNPMQSRIAIPVSIAGLHILACLAYLARSQFRFLMGGVKPLELKLITFWSLAALLCIACIFAGFFSGNRAVFSVGATMQASGMIFLFFARNRFPDFFDQLKLQYRTRKYEVSALKGLNSADIRRRLQELMQLEHLYLQPKFGIDDLAKCLMLSRAQLSQFLNSEMKMDFRNYVNSWRIRHAADLLARDPNVSVLRACYDSGFETKSAFQEAFRKFTGRNPTDYRKEVNRGQSAGVS